MEQEASCYSNSAGNFSSPPLKKSSRTSGDVDTELDKQLTLKPNKVTCELTSVLTLVFQGDSLGRSGSERQFMTPSSSFHLKSTRLKRSNNFSKKETYLSSLRVLTNALAVMSNLILLGESMEELSVEDR